MLHILVSILKIIGILLLVLLILLLIVIISILFIPFGYRIRVKKEKSFDLKVDISWLFHLIHVIFVYDKESSFECHIFGIPVYHTKDKKQKDKKQKNAKREKQAKQDETQEPEVCRGKKDEQQNSERSQKQTDPGRKNNDYTSKGFYDKLKKWKAILSSEDLKWIVNMALSTIKTLLGHIKPNKIKGNIEFGFDDPANTGELLGVIGMLFPVLPEELIIIPDFTESVFKGWIDAKGRIFGIFILKEIVKILLDGKTIPIVKKYMHKEA